MNKPRTFSIADLFLDAALERSLLAATASNPDVYWEIREILPADAFASEDAAWQRIASAIESDSPASVDPAWKPTADPRAAAVRLADLAGRRRIGGLLEQVGSGLCAKEPQALESLVAALEDGIGKVRAATTARAGGAVVWGDSLVNGVLEEADAARRRRAEGVEIPRAFESGLRRIDDALTGLRSGLLILAGPPGVGKTSLAAQIASKTARDGGAALYITYENSPQNLAKKILCAHVRVSPSALEEGTVDLARLRAGAAEMAPAIARIGFVEGASVAAVARLRVIARTARARHPSGRFLVIVDYLQRAAHREGYEQLRQNVSSLSGALRDLGVALNCPTLVLSSVNRGAGLYGEGGGSTRLDSLKESGDVEYDADGVFFLLNPAKRRADPPARAVDLVLAKNRYGESDVLVPLVFRPDIGVLREQA